MQIENLQVGDGSVAGINLMALGDERLGKIVGPACFGALDLDQSGANGVGGGARLTALNLVDNVRQTFVHLFLIAGIAAEKEIIHVEAIQHDLVTHGSDGANAIESHRGVAARRAPLDSCEHIHDEQNQQAA